MADLPRTPAANSRRRCTAQPPPDPRRARCWRAAPHSSPPATRRPAPRPRPSLPRRPPPRPRPPPRRRPPRPPRQPRRPRPRPPPPRPRHPRAAPSRRPHRSPDSGADRRASRPPPRTSPASRVNIACNPTSIAHGTEAGKQWSSLTGGTAVATLVPFAERALKFAADIVDHNSHFDLLLRLEGLRGAVRRQALRRHQHARHRHERLRADHAPAAGQRRQDLCPAAVRRPGDVHLQHGVLDPGRARPGRRADLLGRDVCLHAEADRAQRRQGRGERHADRPTRARRTGSATTTRFNVPFLSDDKTQVLFDNDQGKATWDAINKGFTSKFYGPSGHQRGIRPRRLPDLQPGPRRRRRSGSSNGSRPGAERQRQGLQGHDPEDGGRRRPSCPASSRTPPARSS